MRTRFSYPQVSYPQATDASSTHGLTPPPPARLFRLGLLAALLLWSVLAGQAQEIEWQNCVGGSAADNSRSFVVANDGSYVIVGSTKSYDVPNLKKSSGDLDMLVLKMNSKGNVLWQQHYGGSLSEEAHDVAVTRDGGYVIAGYTDSKDYTKGEKDFFLVRLDAVGTKLWERAYGGTENDIATAVQVMQDNTILVAGESGSANGDVNRNQGGLDFWILHLDIEGNILWQKNFGGPGNDNVTAIEATSDGNYLILGSTDAAGGDVANHSGNTDLFMIKISPSGSLIWKKTYGGSGFDQPYDLASNFMNAGQVLITGTTSSTDGQISGTKGGSDVFVALIDKNGNLVWNRSYGGTGDDGANSISMAFDGNFLVAGTTRSRDGDLLENKGNHDAWLFKINPSGQIRWSKTIGGRQSEQFYATQEVPGEAFLAIGFTGSSDGDLQGIRRMGGNDFWIVKLDDPDASKNVISLTPTTLIGYIRDAKTRKFIKADVKLINDKRNQQIQKVESDTVYGIYQVFLPEADKASIGVSAPGYLFYSKDVTVSPDEQYSEIRLDIDLQPIEKEGAIQSYSIYFEPGKFELLPESYPELDRVYDFLKQNPRVRLEIAGHTDGSGDPDTKVLLSTYRARAVRDYLMKKGIRMNRLEYKGYGFKKPLISPEVTDEDRRRNRRVEFIILDY